MPRCVAERYFPPGQTITFGLCPFADDRHLTVEIHDVRFLRGDKPVILQYGLTPSGERPGEDTCPRGGIVWFLPDPTAYRLTALCTLQQGRMIYEVAIVFRRGRYRDGLYRWKRGDAQIELIRTLPEDGP
jgi:hypothetical protein